MKALARVVLLLGAAAVGAHDLFHAERVYGREHKYRKGESVIAGGSPRTVPVAREAMAAR